MIPVAGSAEPLDPLGKVSGKAMIKPFFTILISLLACILIVTSESVQGRPHPTLSIP
jgi:hypothetical protein